MSEELRAVVVPRDLYYHEIAYVRGLERRCAALEMAMAAACEEFENVVNRPSVGRAALAEGEQK